MLDEIITRSIPLPLTVKALTARDCNGDLNIYTNALLSIETQKKAAEHERRHYQLGHFDDDRPVKVKEEEVELYNKK